MSYYKNADTYVNIKYIYDSNDEGITYKYNFTDVDKTIIDNNFYYHLFYFLEDC